jgi:hypothetical protein
VFEKYIGAGFIAEGNVARNPLGACFPSKINE